MLRKILACFFILTIVLVSYQCAQRGTPTGGPKDETPPAFVSATPPNMSVNFKAKKIKIYFDELIKLKDVQKQLIVSPPLKYPPLLSPMGNATKFVEITIKDTLAPNTTYTFNFGQAIVDNNEENPSPYFTYVFSTGAYIDSLELKGVVKDAFNKNPDSFISVMLYTIDSTYTDSTVFKRPPNYITNTLDSAFIFNLKNLKKGAYALFALKDASNNNMFDQKTDKIGFLNDTISLPTDAIYLLNLFKEVPDYGAAVPSMIASNKISFGYYGNGDSIHITPITSLPDSVKYTVVKEKDKDTLNFWFTPFEMDSILFSVTQESLKVSDTFKVKARKLEFDSLKVGINQQSNFDMGKPLQVLLNTPLIAFDTSKIKMINKDSSMVVHKITKDDTNNLLLVDFEPVPSENYTITLLPGAVTDFYTTTNDTLVYKLRTKSPAEYGNLTLQLTGAITYPLLIQLTNEKGDVIREHYTYEERSFEFMHLNPGKYVARVIFDTNENGKWDTGNFLKKIQPEKISYYPKTLELRANWEAVENFNLID